MTDRLFDVSAFAYAHRGLWDAALPENSMAAFKAARSAGVGVELDVRLTSDGTPIVFHDAGLHRMCNRPESIADLDANALADCRLPDGSPIPTLEAVLDIMADLPVLIELKVDADPGAIADRVAETIASRHGRLAVMSFDEATVARLCQLVRDRPVGLLVSGDHPPAPTLLTKAATARALGCDYIAPHHSVLRTVAAASGGLPLVTWTVRTKGDLALSRAHGAAPIFETISPALAKQAQAPI
jgi:glycerophosphoryl diester phosphodiesterase